MLSVPPARYRSASPTVIERDASSAAAMPEPQSRFTVSPPASVLTPLSRPMKRATLRLSSPDWQTLPMITSSIRSTGRSDRAISARTT